MLYNGLKQAAIASILKMDNKMTRYSYLFSQKIPITWPDLQPKDCSSAVKISEREIIEAIVNSLPDCALICQKNKIQKNKCDFLFIY